MDDGIAVLSILIGIGVFFLGQSKARPDVADDEIIAKVIG